MESWDHLSPQTLPTRKVNGLHKVYRILTDNDVSVCSVNLGVEIQSLVRRKFGSIQFSRSVLSDSLRPHGRQQARPPCPSPTPGTYLNSCPWSRWCHPTISSSVIPFSFCLQSFPASGSFPMSHFYYFYLNRMVITQKGYKINLAYQNKIKKLNWTSLVVQRLRIHQPVWGT